MPANRKPTAAQLEDRISTIVGLCVMGVPRVDIIRYVAKIGLDKDDDRIPWDVCNKTIDNYLAAAKVKISEHATLIADYEIGLGLKRLEDLYMRAVAITDYGTALRVQKERHALLGISKQEPLVKIFNAGIEQQTNFSHMTDEELDAEIARDMQKYKPKRKRKNRRLVPKKKNK